MAGHLAELAFPQAAAPGRQGVIRPLKMAEISECLPLPFPAIGFPAFLRKCHLPNSLNLPTC
jgi:hypothetical protein